MNFAWALAELQLGFKVTRISWKNSRFLWLKPAACVQPDWCHDPVLKELAEQQNGVSATDTICVCFQEMGGAWNITTGWTPQQYDLFAEDWMEWQTTEQDRIAKLPKAGSMENCEILSNAINQLLESIGVMPHLTVTLVPGPEDKELTIAIRETSEKGAANYPIHVNGDMQIIHHEEGIACHVINPDGITKSSIGSDTLNDKVED